MHMLSPISLACQRQAAQFIRLVKRAAEVHALGMTDL